MPADVVLGLQAGDEGKGKVVDYLAKNYDYVVRFNGGNNAGHTLVVNGHRIAVHALPSGILHPHVNNVIGNGCVIDPEQLAKEINEIGPSSLVGRLFISHAAHIIVPDARDQDKTTGQKVGTTGRGIGPTYSAKMQRTGFRMEDLVKGSLDHLYSEDTLRLIGSFVVNTTKLLQTAIISNANILLEGAQGALLDIDHGTYPYVTSSNCSIGGALTGTGLNHKDIRKVIGVAKAYTTRVGEGPFPSEQNNEYGNKLREIGQEYGTTTGRTRRCGWFDTKMVHDACKLNGVDEVIITKIDVLDSFDTIPVFDAVLNLPSTYQGWNCSTKGLRKKEQLPENLLKYVTGIVRTKVSHISTSPEREDMIVL